jgi:hypothetical protein
MFKISSNFLADQQIWNSFFLFVGAVLGGGVLFDEKIHQRPALAVMKAIESFVRVHCLHNIIVLAFFRFEVTWN